MGPWGRGTIFRVQYRKLTQYISLNFEYLRNIRPRGGSGVREGKTKNVGNFVFPLIWAY